MLTVQCERSPYLCTLLIMPQYSGSRDTSAHALNTSSTARPICTLFSRRIMRLLPPRPSEPAAHNAPNPAAAPAANPLQNCFCPLALLFIFMCTVQNLPMLIARSLLLLEQLQHNEVAIATSLRPESRRKHR